MESTTRTCSRMNFDGLHFIKEEPSGLRSGLRGVSAYNEGPYWGMSPSWGVDTGSQSSYRSPNATPSNRKPVCPESAHYCLVVSHAFIITSNSLPRPSGGVRLGFNGGQEVIRFALDYALHCGSEMRWLVKLSEFDVREIQRHVPGNKL